MTDDSTPASAGPEPLTVDAAAARLTEIDAQPKPAEASTEPEAEEATETDTPSEEAQEASDEAGTDDDAEPVATSDDSRKIRLRDGREFSEADAKRALGRESAHAREMAEAAAKQKEAEAKVAQISQKEEYLSKALNHALQVAQAKLPPRPDPALADSDPIEYFVQKDKFERAVNEIRGLQHLQQQQEAKAKEEQDARHRDYVATEQKKLVEKVPEFKSEKARKAFWDEAAPVLMDHYGFTKDLVEGVIDHRLMLLVKDGVAYRKLQSEKPKAVEKAKDAPPVSTPAKRPARTEIHAQKRTDALQRLRQTGSLDDAVAILNLS